MKLDKIGATRHHSENFLNRLLVQWRKQSIYRSSLGNPHSSNA
jgi:hypothetical protein